LDYGSDGGDSVAVLVEVAVDDAKGTAEVNLKITMTWDRELRQPGDAGGHR
jgi:hypothetical protein